MPHSSNATVQVRSAGGEWEPGTILSETPQKDKESVKTPSTYRVNFRGDATGDFRESDIKNAPLLKHTSVQIFNGNNEWEPGMVLAVSESPIGYTVKLRGDETVVVGAFVLSTKSLAANTSVQIFHGNGEWEPGMVLAVSESPIGYTVKLRGDETVVVGAFCLSMKSLAANTSVQIFNGNSEWEPGMVLAVSESPIGYTVKLRGDETTVVGAFCLSTKSLAANTSVQIFNGNGEWEPGTVLAVSESPIGYTVKLRGDETTVVGAFVLSTKSLAANTSVQIFNGNGEWEPGTVLAVSESPTGYKVRFRLDKTAVIASFALRFHPGVSHQHLVHTTPMASFPSIAQQVKPVPAPEPATEPATEQAKAATGAAKPVKFEEVECCRDCNVQFGFFTRRHHCRMCGGSFCDEHCDTKLILPGYEQKQRACDKCVLVLTVGTQSEHGHEGDVTPLSQSSNASAIVDWLDSLGLACYATSIVNQGYTAFTDFVGIPQTPGGDQELESITISAGMKMPHARKFVKAARALAGAPNSIGGPKHKSVPEPQPEPEELLWGKFVSSVSVIKMGKPSDAAHGLQVLLGLSDDALGAILHEREVAIEREFMSHGKPQDKDNFRRVRDGSWGDGKTLQSLVAHPDSVAAKLKAHHILALRLYTTQSFACVNAPLRREPPMRPHPFAATTFFISDAIKKLRAVAANRPDAYDVRTFWRGMRDLDLSMEFMKNGGTDYACMSTSASRDVAIGFASSKCPLIFKYESKDFISRGADVSFLSVYPAEHEALYPPLTFLRVVETKKEDMGGMMVLVATVERSSRESAAHREHAWIGLVPILCVTRVHTS